MTSPIYRVAGIAGSLRTSSYNRGVLRAASRIAAPELEVGVIDLTPTPIYDGDVDQAGQPEPVVAMKHRIEATDGAPSRTCAL